MSETTPTLNGISQHAIDLMRHALGYTSHPKSQAYRNYYTVSPRCDVSAEWDALCVAGLAVRAPDRPIFGGDACYHVSEAGEALIAADHARRRAKHGMREFILRCDDAEWSAWATSAGAARMAAAREWVDCGASMRDALCEIRVRVAEPQRRAPGGAA